MLMDKLLIFKSDSFGEDNQVNFTLWLNFINLMLIEYLS